MTDQLVEQIERLRHQLATLDTELQVLASAQPAADRARRFDAFDERYIVLQHLKRLEEELAEDYSGDEICLLCGDAVPLAEHLSSMERSRRELQHRLDLADDEAPEVQAIDDGIQVVLIDPLSLQEVASARAWLEGLRTVADIRGVVPLHSSLLPLELRQVANQQADPDSFVEELPDETPIDHDALLAAMREHERLPPSTPGAYALYDETYNWLPEEVEGLATQDSAGPVGGDLAWIVWVRPAAVRAIRILRGHGFRVLTPGVAEGWTPAGATGRHLRSNRSRPVAWLVAPDGARKKIGYAQIGFLTDLVLHGPHRSVTAWVRHHLGRDHGYRREDVWRYVQAGMAVIENPNPGRDRRGRLRSRGRVHAPQHTTALVHWWLGRIDTPEVVAVAQAGWALLPGSHPDASGRPALGIASP